MTSWNRMEIGEGIKGLIGNAEKREDLEGGWRILRDRIEGRRKRERKEKERDVMLGNHLELFERTLWFPAYSLSPSVTHIRTKWFCSLLTPNKQVIK
jgi:hypothetical protein